jgi:hypothetical protein
VQGGPHRAIDDQDAAADEVEKRMDHALNSGGPGAWEGFREDTNGR